MKPNYKHGMYKSLVYKRWIYMKQRCARDVHYVSQGITVCDRWLSFANFLADMGEPPEGMTLDRIDGTKGYSPDNCRWATITQQNNNLRSNHRVDGKTINQIAKETGLSHTTVLYRTRNNLPIEQPRIAERTHCKKGHEWSTENTYTKQIKYKDGYREQRYCRKCRAEYQRELRKKTIS